VFAKRTFQIKLKPFKDRVIGFLPPEDSRPEGCYAKQQAHYLPILPNKVPF
jgi:hypothetical protein